jgi:hypothetical protein
MSANDDRQTRGPAKRLARRQNGRDDVAPSSPGEASSSSSSKVSNNASMLAHLGINRHALFETVANALVGAFASGKQPKGLPELPRTKRLSKNVVRILGGNPSALTLQGTNTYLVGSGEVRWLIDAGDGRRKCGYGDALRTGMKEHKVKRLHGILLTHWHPDHAFGVSAVRKASGV